MQSARVAPGPVGRWSHLAVDALRGLAVLGGARDLRELTSPVALPGSATDLVIVVSALAAVTARRFPVLALAVAAVMDALPYWLPISGLGYHLSLMICLYAVASGSPRRTAAAAAALTCAAQVALMAYERDWRVGDFFVVFVAMSDLLAIALGVAARSRRAALRLLEERAEEAERSRDSEARKRVAEERLRVARDLHDSVAHQIAVMNLNTSVASAALPDRPDDAQQALLVVHEAGRSVLASIGDLLAGLREENVDDPEPRYDLDELRVLVEEFRLLMPSIRFDPSQLAVPATRQISAVTYLVVREGLVNAYKHGDHGSPVEVRLHLGEDADRVELANATRDDAPEHVPGFGLRGMRERVAAAGGRLAVSESDRVFTVSALVPAGVPAKADHR